MNHFRTFFLTGLVSVSVSGCGRINNKKEAPGHSDQSREQQKVIEALEEEKEQLDQRAEELQRRTEELERRAGELAIKDEEHDRAIASLEQRVTAAEGVLGELHNTVSDHSVKILEIDTVKKEVAAITTRVDELAGTTMTREEFRTKFAVVEAMIGAVTGRVDTLERDVTGLSDTQAALALDVSDLKAWKQATASFLEGLQRTDITAAMADLQLWKRNIQNPLENMMQWFQTAEERVSALESFQQTSSQCFRMLDPDFDAERPVPGDNSTLEACDNLYRNVEQLQRLFGISEGLSADLDALRQRLEGVESQTEEQRQLLESLQVLRIRDQFSSARNVRICGSEAHLSAVNASVVFSHESFLRQEGTGSAEVTGILSNGRYEIPDICSFNVITHYKVLTEIEKLALGLPDNITIAMPAVCWNESDSTICHSVFGPFSALGA